jgi:hypothetical protein
VRRRPRPPYAAASGSRSAPASRGRQRSRSRSAAGWAGRCCAPVMAHTCGSAPAQLAASTAPTTSSQRTTCCHGAESPKRRQPAHPRPRDVRPILEKAEGHEGWQTFQCAIRTPPPYDASALRPPAHDPGICSTLGSDRSCRGQRDRIGLGRQLGAASDHARSKSSFRRQAAFCVAGSDAPVRLFRANRGAS